MSATTPDHGLLRPLPLYVNLPVTDLERSRRFFDALGFRFDPKFTDENALAMHLGDDARFMLLRRPFFARFTRLPISEATQATEVLLAVERENRAAVDRMVDRALELGGRTAMDAQTHGSTMYSRSFHDLDGHHWEILATAFDPDFVGCTTRMPSERDIVFSRRFKAPRMRVFAAWTQADQLLRWYGGGAMRSCEVDLRPGGAYRFVTGNGPADDLVERGTYLRVVMGESVLFTEQWEGGSPCEQIVSATFDDEPGDITRLSVRFTFARDAVMDQALANGMPGHFEETCHQLAAYLSDDAQARPES